MRGFLSFCGVNTIFCALGLLVVCGERLLAADAKDVLQEIRGTVQPWQPFKEAWATRATMIFRATYRDTHLPCLHIGDSWIMPRGAEFTVVQVLKGDVRYKNIILEHPGREGRRLPHALVEDRSYLVFLRPGPQTLKQMAEKDANWVRLADWMSEVVAIVDLSQSKAETDALAVKATRSGTYQGYQFTPERWTSLRAAKAVDLQAQRELVPFLVHVALADRATLGDVRSYLGEPDHETFYPGGCDCHYNFYKTVDPEDGQISGSLQVTFGRDLAVAEYRIEFSRCKIERGRDFTGISWSVLSDAEHEKLRLPLVKSKEKDQ